MSEENPKPVNVDPRWYVLDAGSTARTNKLIPDSIQEALRMFLQPIKNNDPQLDFYTIYKREMIEYNEDLDTTLIFVCVLCLPTSLYSVDHILRPIYSPQLAPPS